MRESIKFVLSFLGVATIYVGLLSYAVIISYYTGYLGEFGVRIENISFLPSLYDFLVQASPAVIALFIISIIVLLLLLSVNYALKLIAAKTSGHKKLHWFSVCAEMGVMPKAYMSAIIIACLVVLSFKIALSDSYMNGSNNAKKQDVFTVLGTNEKKTLDVIVYQNDNVAVVKKYDEYSGKFSNGYRITSLLDKNLEIKKIP